MTQFRFADRFQQALLTIAMVSAFALLSLVILETEKENSFKMTLLENFSQR